MKARVLTENEYVEMMKEKDRQEKEAGVPSPGLNG